MAKQPITLKLELPSIFMAHQESFRRALWEETMRMWLEHDVIKQEDMDRVVIEITEQSKGKKA